MALTRKQKEKIIENLKENISQAKAVIFVGYKGLKVPDLFELRKKLKEKEGKFLVAKKTLMGLVFKENKIEVKPKEIEGQIALVFGFKDELSSAKAVYQFSQQNKDLKILGGFIESQKNEFLTPETIIALGQLPSREEILANMVGSISAPISNFVNALSYNLRSLTYIISQIKVK